MKWLITGGCGFIGARLVQRLLSQGGHQLVILDNLSVGTPEDLEKVCSFEVVEPETLALAKSDTAAPGVALVKGDILDAELVLQAAVGMDVIVHLAANTGVPKSVQDPRMDCVTNVLGSFNCLEAARLNNVKRFVFASSGAPVGNCEPPIHEEICPHPVSPYGASKLSIEGYCSAYYRTFGVETVALRFGNVYGPGSGHKTSIVAKFIKQAVNGETLEIYGDGSQTRDYIYIDDIVNALILAAETPNIGGEIFQIATSSETTVSELTDMLVQELGRRGVTGVKVEHTEERLGDVKRNFSDTRKAREKLGWHSRTSLPMGLDQTIGWFLDGKRQSN